MQSIKRDLVLGFGFCALTFACAVAWGGPFLQRAPDPQPLQVEQAQVSQPVQSSTFTGTIVRNGDQYCLRDSSGQI